MSLKKFLFIIIVIVHVILLLLMLIYYHILLCFHFAIFSLYWGPPEKPINCLNIYEISVPLPFHGMSQLLIFWLRTYVCKHFFIESLRHIHLNVQICTGIVSINSEQIILTAVWRTKNMKLKAWYEPPPHLSPLPLARYMFARDFYLFI